MSRPYKELHYANDELLIVWHKQHGSRQLVLDTFLARFANFGDSCHILVLGPEDGPHEMQNQGGRRITAEQAKQHVQGRLREII